MLLFLFCLSGKTQNFTEAELRKIDSLSSLAQSSDAHDTSRVLAYVSLSEMLYVSSIDTLQELCEKALEVAFPALEKSTNKAVSDHLRNSMATAYNNIGYVYDTKGELPKAIENYSRSLEMYKELGEEDGISMALSNLGYSYDKLGDIERALENYNEALKIDEKSGNKEALSVTLNNVAYVYQRQSQTEKAFEYYERSLSIKREVKDRFGESVTLNNMGVLLYKAGEFERALDYYKMSLAIKRELGNKTSVISSLSNIGQAYFRAETLSDGQRKNMLDTAKQYFEEAYQLSIETQNQAGEAITLNNLSGVYRELGQLTKAEELGQQALDVSKEIGYVEDIKSAAQNLSSIYEMQNKGMEALKYYRLYHQMTDSLKNDKTVKAAAVQQTKHEYEKAKILQEQEAREKARMEEETISRRNSLQYSVILISILLLFGLVLALGFIRVSPKVAEGLIFFAFLILFEFLLVLSDPYVDDFANGEPLFKLLINACIAGAIFPAHAFFEKSLKKRLIKS